MWDSYQLVGHAVQEWVYQGLYGLSGVGNIWGGVWVVLKLEWQPLHQGAPPVKSCRVRLSPPHQPHPLLFLFLSLYSSTGAFCFLFRPISILASAVVRGLSTSRSATSPPSSFWPRRHLLSRIQNGRFVYFRRLISVECIVKHCLATNIAM